MRWDMKPLRLRLVKIGLETTRCRSRQIFGGAKDFCPNLLTLTWKICVVKMIKTFLGSHTEKGLHVSYGEEKSQIQTNFDSQSHSSQNENKVVEKSVPTFFRIFSVFSEILPGFLTNQNIWGCTCTPLHSRLLHHCQNWPRDQVSRPHHCYMVLNTCTNKISMQYSC